MYLDNEFYSLKLRTCFQNSLRKSGHANTIRTVLSPLLAIRDLRDDERIEYVSGKQSILELKKIIDEGKFAVGFILFPSNINEIKALADADLIMLQKHL
jgi:uncharacterized protein (DUF1015 family)